MHHYFGYNMINDFSYLESLRIENFNLRCRDAGSAETLECPGRKYTLSFIDQ